jgi:hypothetical protein
VRGRDACSDGLPIIDSVPDRLGLPALLEQALPAGDAHIKLAPAVAVRLVVTNLVAGQEPLDGLGDWRASHIPNTGPNSVHSGMEVPCVSWPVRSA